MDEGGVQEEHVAALVHDGGAALAAGDLAWEDVLLAALGRVVVDERFFAGGEVDVGLFEDGCLKK